jgi:alginate O-acetyltransferase complex protein AlgI
MIFNSIEFLLFFPVVLMLYYRLGRRAQNVWLLAASYFFYGWWDWRFCSLLLVSTVVDYACGLGMVRHPARKRAWLLLSMATNLGILGFFKYFNFFVDTAAALLTTVGLQAHVPVLQIILPVGISFYTFQTMSYTIDVYRGHLKPTRSLLDFAVYVAFFPQLVAGPIERATHLLPQFASPRVVTRAMVESGCFLTLLGLFRKVVIADGVAPMVNAAFASAHTASWAQLSIGALLFAIQIYCDFAGYSDIARGTARLLGIELMVNFNQPYLSRSITEFWRRWHISLSTWLRDYLYIPLGGNRHGTGATYRNLLLTMLLGGLWHGARWNFVIWGGLHGLYLALHKLWMARRTAPPAGDSRFRFTPGTVAGLLLTFLLVDFAWIFFRSASLADAIGFIEGILTLRGGWAGLPFGWGAKLLVFAGLTLFADWPAYVRNRQEGLLDWPWFARGVAYAAMVLLLIVLRPLDDTPFIYFQF